MQSREWGAVRRLNWLWAAIILLLGLVTVVVGFRLIVHSRSVMLLDDEWDEVGVALGSAPGPSLSWLWAQHSEHRVPFYRILALADIHFFHGSHWIGFAALAAVQCLLLVVLVWLVRASGIRGAPGWAALGLAAFCTFCPSQHENFIWAFQVSFLLLVLLFVSSVAALVRYRLERAEARNGWLWIALSVVLAAATCGCAANGILSCVILLALAWSFRCRGRVLLAYTLAELIVVGTYFHSYVSPAYHASPLRSLLHPRALLAYMAAYMGVHLPPRWEVHSHSFAIMTGWFGLALGLGLAVRAFVRRTESSPLALAFAGLVSFSTGTAFLTALGRVNFGIDQAFAPRYRGFALLFWFGTCMLLLLLAEESAIAGRLASAWRCPECGDRWKMSAGAILVTMVLTVATATVGLSVGQYGTFVRASRVRTLRAEAAGLALLLGVPDEEALSAVHPVPATVWQVSSAMRARGLGIFADRHAAALGRPVASLFEVRSEATCRGFVDTTQYFKMEGGYGVRITGWAMDSSWRQPVKEVIAVTGGIISGIGVVGFRRPDVKVALGTKRALDSGWQAYTLIPAPDTEVDLFGVPAGSERQLCRIARLRLAGPVTP